tara:strand:- start:21569 stop:22132 length:564 start_codon:yes stop_codon:yes gene_type:complete
MTAAIKGLDLKDRRNLSRFVGARGCELGVWKGKFSEQLLRNSDCQEFYSIDRWAGDRGHDKREYLKATRRLKRFGSRSMILRLEFSEALTLFPDGFFDFVYIDGYAHTGQDDGKTIDTWYDKVKPGGCFSGHDYHPDFPLVIKHVDEFVSKHQLQLYVTQDKVPSWFVFRPYPKPKVLGEQPAMKSS